MVHGYYSCTDLMLRNILPILIQNRHNLIDTAVCVMWYVWLCTVSGGFVLDYI